MCLHKGLIFILGLNLDEIEMLFMTKSERKRMKANLKQRHDTIMSLKEDKKMNGYENHDNTSIGL